MEACSMVYAKLDELNIPYDVVEHPPYTPPTRPMYTLRGARACAPNLCFLPTRKKRRPFIYL